MNSLCLNTLFLRIIYLCGVFLNILRFAIPIILILKLVLDVFKQVINPNDEEGKKYIKNRVIASIIVFLIPTVIEVLFYVFQVVFGNSYSELTVCREFATLDHIEALEKEKEKLVEDEYNNDMVNNLSSYKKIVDAVRDYVEKNKNNDTNANNNSNSDDNNTTPDNNNLSGALNKKKYSNWNYYLYVPSSANSNNKKALVVFLHGSGEKGSNISLLEKYGFAKYIKKGSNYDAYILIPQLTSGEVWDTGTNRNKLMDLIKKTVNENYIDSSRISISGFSLGTLPISNLLNENRNYFSAVVLIGQCDSGEKHASYYKNIPVKIFTGDGDQTCGYRDKSIAFVNYMKKINSDVEFVVYKNQPHNVVDLALQDGKVLNWMISKKR